MDRVRVIERTYWCYWAGWGSLVPILGLIPALFAFHLFWQVRAELNGDWNPAGMYLGWGLALATIGAAGSLILVAGPLFRAVQ